MAEWDMGADAAEQPDAGELALCPEGMHAFDVKEASEGPHKYMDGEFLSLQLADTAKRWGLVFCDISKDARGASLAKSLAAALGISAAGGKVRLVPADLVNRRVMAEIYHRASKSGRTYANVRRFRLIPDTGSGAVETATAKPGRARREQAPQGDDIPF